MKSDRLRVWKFLLVPVLFGAIGMFVYSAFQFTDPRFSFIPKGSATSRSYVVVKSSPPGPDELQEVSVYKWESDYGNLPRVYPPEINARGFAEVPGYGGVSGQRILRNKDGDAVVWEPHQTIQGMTTSGGCVIVPSSVSLTFVHTERRGGYVIVKKLINWFRRL